MARGNENLSERGRPSVFVQVIIGIMLFWAAHAAAFFLHEYAHSFAAWITGWKANPLALNYGHLSVGNLLVQGEIDENVDYAPIFAAGRGTIAALIAVAGVLLGNGGGYILSRWLYRRSRARERSLAAAAIFLFLTMNTGNLIAYVPNRAFADHADMATVAQGLGVSPWWIAIVLGIPFCAAVFHLLAKLLPDAMRSFSPGSRRMQIAWLVSIAGMICVFYGQAGYSGYGAISHRIASVWILLVFPLALVLLWPRRSKETS
jgi:hypothetical protein